MTSVSALNHIHKTGLFGNHENKNEESLLKVSEIKNLLIVQIVQYKNSSISFCKGIAGAHPTLVTTIAAEAVPYKIDSSIFL